ncbi:DUF2254 domain-containing protein [Siccirubricoccus sp. G192]|uniref:DUF2254 domain-containing protein n=1 Tax=Siccirubricoccus sp. G192 TaxID=2849651 RepID=UPI001C2C83BE|nr:DUF2254 domain-containing protein [Siccirubricoccus sp. G192]MBV1797475.1 DUF2254 domain-containing protein [Siccirubricoccus sp. G192]
MLARWRQLRAHLAESFWPRPALLVLLGLFLGWLTERLDRAATLPDWLGDLVYSGGAEGARGLLGALATASLGVAGTIFSITIAALSLASGQMGPRLLRNFTRDAGNQVALGAFLGTFAYSLMVLRTIRSPAEGGFVPHLGVTLGVVLGLVCTGVLVWFVHHAAEGINLDRVVEDVAADMAKTLDAHSTEAAEPPAPLIPAPAATGWAGALAVPAPEEGYLQQLDAEGLADWAAEQGCAVRLLSRPGHRVHPGLPLALVQPPVEGAAAALGRAVAIGARRTLADDPGFAVRQLTEIAVRALSPGINDPNTAMTVLDWLGAALCRLAGRELEPGVELREGQMVLDWPTTDYAGLLDVMFHMIRQSAGGSPAVIIRLLETLTVAARLERRPERLAALARHAALAREAGLAGTTDRAGREGILEREQRFVEGLAVDARPGA